MLSLDLWARGLGEDGVLDLMTIRFVCAWRKHKKESFKRVVLCSAVITLFHKQDRSTISIVFDRKKIQSVLVVLI